MAYMAVTVGGLGWLVLLWELGGAPRAEGRPARCPAGQPGAVPPPFPEGDATYHMLFSHEAKYCHLVGRDKPIPSMGLSQYC